MKKFFVNGQEYSLHIEKFVFKDLTHMIDLYRQENIEEFNLFCNALIDKMLDGGLENVPVVNMPEVLKIAQTEIIRVCGLMGFGENSEYSEEDEISDFLRGLD